MKVAGQLIAWMGFIQSLRDNISHLSFVISCRHQACLCRSCRLQVVVHEQGRRYHPSTLGVDPLPG
jgi:hypothetical protein